MAPWMKLTAAAVLYLVTGTQAASLADIEHVVLFMQGELRPRNIISKLGQLADQAAL